MAMKPYVQASAYVQKDITEIGITPQVIDNTMNILNLKIPLRF